MSAPIVPEVVEPAGRVSDPARGGHTALHGHGADHARVDGGGRTALAAAVFRRSEPAVGHPFAAGADPDAGGPRARATATSSDLPAMAALLPPPR